MQSPYVKTPSDFKGDVFSGVEEFLKLDPQLRSYLPFDLCEFDASQRKINCHTSNRHDNLIKQLNLQLLSRPDLFQNDFKFLVGFNDDISDVGHGGIKVAVQKYIATKGDKSIQLDSLF